MVEVVVARVNEVKKLVATSINCSVCNVTGGIVMRAKNSRMIFNFTSFESIDKIIIEFRKVSGNGGIFVRAGNFTQKITVSGKQRVEVPFYNTIEVFRDGSSIGEVSVVYVAINKVSSNQNSSDSMENDRSKRARISRNTSFLNEIEFISNKPSGKYIVLTELGWAIDDYRYIVNAINSIGFNVCLVLDHGKESSHNIIKESLLTLCMSENAKSYISNQIGCNVTNVNDVCDGSVDSVIDYIAKYFNIPLNAIVRNFKNYLSKNSSYIDYGKRYKVSVVISIKNRLKFLKYTIETYIQQTMPKDDFELIFVDDGSTEDIGGFLKNYSDKLNIKYVKIESKRSEIPIWSHTPALSNNVGFKHASGNVIVICGPEILHKKDNLQIAYEAAQKNISAFGLVWHSNLSFVNNVFSTFNPETSNFDKYINTPGAKANCITQNSYYWYLFAAKKEHIMKIGGVDEEYGRGVCGEDDNFAARLNESRIPNTHVFDMVGIHMEHEAGDDRYDVRRHRETKEWKQARELNTSRWNNWHKTRTVLANDGKDWGSDKVVDELMEMNNGFVYDYKNFDVSTKYDLSGYKVLYLSLGHQPGVENAFRKFGVDLRVFNFWDMFTISKVPGNKINSDLLEIVNSFKPDLIHMQLQYTGIISPETIRRIKQNYPNTKISNWSGDVRANVPNYFIDIGKAADYTLICNTGQIPKLVDMKCNGVNYWQMGIDTKTNFPKYQESFKYDCCFIGNCYSEFPGMSQRVNFAKAMKARYGNRFAIFGSGWGAGLSIGQVPWVEVNNIYNISKVVVSISNFNEIADYFSDRFLMAMASGRPTMSWHFPNIEKYLIDGQSGYVMHSVEDGVAKMAQILGKSDNELNAIGKRGACEILKHHTFVSRVYDLFKLIGAIK